MKRERTQITQKRKRISNALEAVHQGLAVVGVVCACIIALMILPIVEAWEGERTQITRKRKWRRKTA